MKIRVPEHEGYYRYVMLEGDGTSIPRVAYNQRPAAERYATREGLGLFDMRERVLLVAPDLEKRIEKNNRSIAYAEEKLTNLQDMRFRLDCEKHGIRDNVCVCGSRQIDAAGRCESCERVNA